MEIVDKGSTTELPIVVHQSGHKRKLMRRGFYTLNNFGAKNSAIYRPEGPPRVQAGEGQPVEVDSADAGEVHV